MQQEEIKHVVTETLSQLLKNDMLKFNDTIVYKQMSDLLKAYYKNKKGDLLITEAIASIKDDAYYMLIDLYYNKGWTLERLAETYEVDICTIVRNKKRLCLKLFSIIN